jgi:hypothetical protein
MATLKLSSPTSVRLCLGCDVLGVAKRADKNSILVVLHTLPPSDDLRPGCQTSMSFAIGQADPVTVDSRAILMFVETATSDDHATQVSMIHDSTSPVYRAKGVTLSAHLQNCRTSFWAPASMKTAQLYPIQTTVSLARDPW